MKGRRVQQRQLPTIVTALLIGRIHAQWPADEYLRIWVDDSTVTCSSDEYCTQHVSWCASTNFSPLGKCFCGDAARETSPDTWNYTNVCIACAKSGVHSCSLSVIQDGIWNYGLSSGAQYAMGRLNENSLAPCEARCLAPGETWSPTPAPTPEIIQTQENSPPSTTTTTATLSADPYVTTPDGERTQIWLPLDSWVPLLNAKYSILHVRAFGRPGTDRNEQWIDGIAVTRINNSVKDDDGNSRNFIIQIELPRDHPIGGKSTVIDTYMKNNRTELNNTTKSSGDTLDFITVKLDDTLLNDISANPYNGSPGSNVSIRLKKFDNKYIIGRQADAAVITTPDFVLVAYTAAAPKYQNEGEAHTYIHLDTKFLAFTDKNECHGILPDLIFGRKIRPIDAATFLRRPNVADGAPLNPFHHFSLDDSVDPFEDSVAASLIGRRRLYH